MRLIVVVWGVLALISVSGPCAVRVGCLCCVLLGLETRRAGAISMTVSMIITITLTSITFITNLAYLMLGLAGVILGVAGGAWCHHVFVDGLPQACGLVFINTFVDHHQIFVEGHQTVCGGSSRVLWRVINPFVEGHQGFCGGSSNRLWRVIKPFVEGHQTVCGVSSRALWIITVL